MQMLKAPSHWQDQLTTYTYPGTLATVQRLTTEGGRCFLANTDQGRGGTGGQSSSGSSFS